MKKVKRRMSSSRIIILGFMAMILTGTLVLMLPFATRNGHSASFMDALFTATSAVCVTGLVAQDTATYWSFFGQAVILFLIQIGGMGVITVAVTITRLSGKRISLKQRSTMQEAISAHQVGGIVKFTNFIIAGTLLLEGLGALIMAPTFCREFGFFKGLWYGIFHSVSAFCNAGFDLMGVKSPYSSLTYFADNWVINLTVCALVVVGGIGFMTWEDICNRKLQFKRYRMQTKVILTTTALLIFLPAIYFFFLEFTAGKTGDRFLLSLFQSVTLRTAGFNTVDFNLVSQTGVALMICIMLVGGSPGSTAGGLKTTTLAVLVSTSVSVFLRKEHTHFFGRRVTDETVRSAAAIFILYLGLFLSGAMVISRVEGLPLLTCMFETGSAVATVGLTMGITQQLGTVSRLILILLMYVGRVGGLTLIFSALSGKRGNTARLPQEKLTVG